MWSYHWPWAAVHFSLRRPLKACVYPRIDCSEWAREVRRSSLSRWLQRKFRIGSAVIQAFRLLIIANCTGGAVLLFDIHLLIDGRSEPGMLGQAR